MSSSNQWSKASVPPGTFIATTSIISIFNDIRRRASKQVERYLGGVDFILASGHGLLYVSEADLIKNDGLIDRMKALEVFHTRTILVCISETTERYYTSLSHEAAEIYGANVISVGSIKEAEGLILRILDANKSSSSSSNCIDLTSAATKVMMDCLLSIPSLGKINATELLEAFHNLQGVANADETMLRQRVPRLSVKQAQAVYWFFNRSLNPQ